MYRTSTPTLYAIAKHLSSRRFSFLLLFLFLFATIPRQLQLIVQLQHGLDFVQISVEKCAVHFRVSLNVSGVFTVVEAVIQESVAHPLFPLVNHALLEETSVAQIILNKSVILVIESVIFVIEFV